MHQTEGKMDQNEETMNQKLGYLHFVQGLHRYLHQWCQSMWKLTSPEFVTIPGRDRDDPNRHQLEVIEQEQFCKVFFFRISLNMTTFHHHFCLLLLLNNFRIKAIGSHKITGAIKFRFITGPWNKFDTVVALHFTIVIVGLYQLYDEGKIDLSHA